MTKNTKIAEEATVAFNLINTSICPSPGGKKVMRRW